VKSDKIVIVGAGSSGWMVASFLIKTFPNKDISVIESKEYWAEAAKNAPSLYEYLRDNVHNN